MLNTERLCLGCMNDNGGEKICSICGFDNTTPNDAEYLPLGYWIKDRYLVGRVTEHNGEGVTYVGWDNKEDAIVNIREYYPKGAANRNADGTVQIAVGSEFTFNEGIMSFLELNRKIASLVGLPSLFTTVEVFEEGGTAYRQSAGAFRGFEARDNSCLSMAICFLLQLICCRAFRQC